MARVAQDKARRLMPRALASSLRRALLMSVVVACGFVASVASAEIKSAQFTDPTTRYPHAVLGDNIEWGALEVRLDNGKTRRFILPETRVYEDLEPRLVDVDLDGDLEIIVVESSQTQGGRLVIYDEDGVIAATPYIGRKFRWLAPIGATDLDSDGRVEVAYVDRPHLAKTLRVWRFEKGALKEVARLQGVTNHRIGEDYISGGLRDCGTGPEMIVADANWRQVVAVTFDGKSISSKEIAPFAGQESFSAALNCQ